MADPSTPDPAFRALDHSAIVCRATGLAAIRIEGEDAPSFLQGQVSSDVTALGAGKSQWSSYNSPKGRMLASLRLWREGDAFGALMAADLAPVIAKRLSMFVLRAKVRIADQSSTHAAVGVGGPRAGKAIQAQLGASPDADGIVATADRQATLVGLGRGGFVVLAANAQAAAIADKLENDATPADEAIWRWLSIGAGVPLVTGATSDQFVPQMLNWDAIDGVSFQKGCYPGQEIVARMRYLGKLKERTYGFRVAAAQEPKPGERIYGSAFGATPCGTVVNAAPAPDGGHGLLAVVQISAADAGGLTLGAVDGPALVPVALPYVVAQTAPPRSRIG